MSYQLFIKWYNFLVSKKLTIEIRYDKFDLWNKLKLQFSIIFVNFEDTKMEENAAWIENDLKVVTKNSCLLGHTVGDSHSRPDS